MAVLLGNSPHIVQNPFHTPSSRSGILVAQVEAATSASCLCLLLHHLGDLHVDVEELGGASVEANALALVKLALAVVVGDALLCADSGKAVDVQALAK
jgi:hypothetical protein